MTCVFATNNPGKVKELKILLQSEGIELLTLSDLGLVFEPEETGTTFEENAIIKATETAALLREKGHEFIVLADDSGIEIDALGKKPGVDSANFLGSETPYHVRNKKIIEMLADIPDKKRTARFVCVIACVLPSPVSPFTTRACVEGNIAREQKGENGFGYDPIFFLPDRGKTTAELSNEEKNEISHRGQSLKKMIRLLREKGKIS